MRVEQRSSQLGADCPCCGSATRNVTGSLLGEDGSEALYRIRWTDGMPDHGIAVLLAFPWVEGFVSALYSFDENSFMVVSEDGHDWGLSDQFSIRPREEVIGTPVAKDVFGALDALWEGDPDLQDFVQDSGG